MIDVGTIKIVRELKGFTLQEIASKLGVHFSAIAQLEQNLPAVSDEKKEKILEILQLNEDYDGQNSLFDCEQLHFFYLKRILRRIDFSPLYNFLTLIKPVESILFVKNKRAICLVIKDVHNCLFLFCARDVKKGGDLGKLSYVNTQIRLKDLRIIEYSFDKKPYELEKSDIESFFVFAYVLSCPRLLDNGVYIPVIPIKTVLHDWLKYLRHEKNKERKRAHIESFVAFYVGHIKKNYDPEYFEKEKKQVLQAWGLDQ